MKLFYQFILIVEIVFVTNKLFAQNCNQIDTVKYSKIAKEECFSNRQFSNIFYNEIYSKFTEMSEITLPVIGFVPFNIQKGNQNIDTKNFLTVKVNPTFFVYQNNVHKTNITIEPNFMIRILNTKNLPINSPSYNPGINVLYRLNNSTMNGFSYLKFGLFHHSNGHVDSLFKSDKSINTKTGRFATNYVNITYNFGSATKGFYSPKDVYKKIYLKYLLINKKDKNELKHFDFKTFRKIKNYALTLQAHTSLVNVGFNKEMNKEYGKLWACYKYTNIISAVIPEYKINSSKKEDVIGEKDREFHRFEFYFNYRLSEIEGSKKIFHSKRINTELSWHQTSSSRQITNFISIGWIGSDPYNLYFKNHYWLFKTGIATNFGLVHRYKPKIIRYEDF